MFRLRQLPPHVDRYDAVELLRDALCIDHSTIKLCSLARSLDPWFESKTATLMFNETIELRDILYNGKGQNVVKSGDEWRIQVQNVPNSLILDTHFRGLTPLHDPTPHSADCIAISGLSSHPFGSWQPKGNSKTFMWIRDALPKSMPNIRPILYGYDTTLVDSNSFQSIFDLARGLLDQLKANGWASPAPKPLIFLAHSLGGLVLKQALVFLANHIERDDPMRRAIIGAVLFGVPNLGMEQSRLFAMVEGKTNAALVAELAPGSKYLEQLHEQFTGISYLQDCLLYWAYETCKSPTVMQDLQGKWMRTGPAEVLVDPESAAPGRDKSTGEQDSIFPINEDHSNMVKFSENDPNYSVVVKKLDCMLEQSKSRVSGAGLARTFTSGWETDIPTNGVHHASGKSTAFTRVLKSLQAPELDRRLEQIEDKFRNTFDWVYDHPQSRFSHWLQHGSGLFWINGKPGSGKSTLMKFIFQDPRTSSLLSDWRADTSHIWVAFFFHYRGTRLQKSFEGLLRSILSQIISKEPKLHAFLARLFIKDDLTFEDWTLRMLQAGFHAILKQTEIPLYLTLFLDALDEYDGRLEFISKFLEDITQIPLTSTKSIKICFSSRPWPIFYEHFRECPRFSIQDFTEEDIRDYCLGSILEERLPPMTLEDLIPDLVTRSRGVFLWVKLVVKNLATSARKKETKSDLENLLKSLPTELDSYYAEIIERIPHAHRWEAYAMLETAVRSELLLAPEDFISAVKCSESRTFDSAETIRKLVTSKITDFAEFVRDQSRMHCGGLIEVVGEPPYQSIQVLHQTVEDFVTDHKFKQLVLEDRAKITAENGFSFLTKYLLLRPLNAFGFSELQALARSAHASEQTTGRSMQIFLDSVPGSVYEERSLLFGRQFFKTPLDFAAFAGLRLYINESLVANPNLLQESKDLLLSSIVNEGFIVGDEVPVETTKLLLDNGYTLNQDPKAFEKLLFDICGVLPPEAFHRSLPWAGEVGQVDLARVMLDRGASPGAVILTHYLPDNQNEIILDRGISLSPLPFHRRGRKKYSVECTPLHPSPASLARLLLNKGALINGLDSRGMTPLDWAFSKVTTSDFFLERWVRNTAEFNGMYERICLLVERGGEIRKTPTSYIDCFLLACARNGLRTDTLQERLLGPKSRVLSLRLKVSKFIYPVGYR